MTGDSAGSVGDPRHVPPGCSRLPEWMRSDDERGSMALLLRRKSCNNDPESETNTPRKPEPALSNPFIVGTTIELAIGSKEARTVNASREGRGSRYILRTTSKNIFEKLQEITELTDKTQVEVIPHPTLNTVQGKVYDLDSVSVGESEILKYLSTQGVHNVRRIKKRVNGDLKDTPLLVLSFHGTVLPTHVYFGVLRIPVSAYYQSPMICFNCGAYGHTGRSCQQGAICLYCSQTHSLAKGEKCTNPPHCLHCLNGHAVTSRDCPKYKTEVNVIRLKVDRGISFPEARRIYADETKNKTFSSVVQDRLNNELAAKDQQIADLQKQVSILRKELTALKNVLSTKNSGQSPVPQTTQTTLSQPLPSQKSASDKSGSSQYAVNRLSRKDKASSSAPPKKLDHIDTHKYDLRNRSKSGKRHMDISPTNGDIPGKRSSTQQSESWNQIECDE